MGMLSRRCFPHCAMAGTPRTSLVVSGASYMVGHYVPHTLVFLCQQWVIPKNACLPFHLVHAEVAVKDSGAS